MLYVPGTFDMSSLSILTISFEAITLLLSHCTDEYLKCKEVQEAKRGSNVI